MARTGVTYFDVAKTAIKLVEQKIYPTIEEIRKSLGSGSNSTISKYLREWRSKHGNQSELEQGLPEPLLMAVRGIYDGITETATSKITFIENESKHAISELKAKLTEVETNHNKLVQDNKSLEDAIQEQRLRRAPREAFWDFPVHQNALGCTTSVYDPRPSPSDRQRCASQSSQMT